MLKQGGYEGHLTVDATYATEVRKLESHDVIFSQISGCPILGQGEYCYLTVYSEHMENAIGWLSSLSRKLNELNVPVLRSKVEHIIYDTKTGVGITEVSSGS
jgi:hypothetical protein